MHRIALFAALAALLIGSVCDAAQAVTMCGRNGCGQIFTKRIVHPPMGFVRRAVPLTIPKTTAVQPVNATK
jgi:hypothetical protein